MKKFFCIFIFLHLQLAFCNLHSQTNVYHPFPDSSWWREDFYGQQPFENFAYLYYSSGDTLIGTTEYKKIWSYYFSIESYYYGGLRDDTIAHKWYFIDNGATVNDEKLLIDFDLDIGDTLKSYWFEGPNADNFIVNSIDSVLVNGMYRKKINCSCFCENDNFIIEGIGASWGILQNFTCFEGFTRLCCLNQQIANDTVLLYSDTVCSIGNDSQSVYCWDSILVTDKSISNNYYEKYFGIYPNPASYVITLDLFYPPASTSISIKCFNVFGQEEKLIYVNNKTQIRVEINTLTVGIYFLQIYDGMQLLKTEKIIIVNK